MSYDSSKPVTGGSLVAADMRENFRALKEDQIVDAGFVKGLPVDFTCSKDKDGYTKLPNGIIIQWGEGLSTIDGEEFFNFPIEFPNSCLSIVTTRFGNNVSVPLAICALDTTYFSINRDDSINGSVYFYYLAIGY